MGLSGAKRFKIKLATGRVLGPLDLERVRQLVLKDRIVGREMAREHPDGDWRDINLVEELAIMLIQRASGELKSSTPLSQSDSEPEALPGGSTQILSGPTQILSGPTQVLPISTLLPLPSRSPPERRDASLTQIERPLNDPDSKTQIETRVELARPPANAAPDIEVKGTSPELEPHERAEPHPFPLLTDHSETENEDGSQSLSSYHLAVSLPQPPKRKISEERTVVLQRPGQAGAKSQTQGGRKSPGEIIKILVIAVTLGVIGQDFLFSDPTPAPARRQTLLIRPRLPISAQQADPALSEKAYAQAMHYYVADTVVGYRQASEFLLQSASLNPNNVKALAMLASCYLNLIDSSNKDENYFSVISKLIDMSRAKSVDLPETVIADVEFYLTANRPEAAKQRIVDYTRLYPNFDPSMFYYLSLAFYARGDAQSAARFIGQFPENRTFSAKLPYLRGQIAEKLGSPEQALAEYEKAVAFNPGHARSHLRAALMLARLGRIKEGAKHVEFTLTHPTLLAAKDLGQAYSLSSQLFSIDQKWNEALGQIERASRLDPTNSDYLLEKYGLRARVGDKNPAIKEEVKMYYFLGEGERFLKEGRQQDAQIQFQQARHANERSPLPLIKIGDMFKYFNDIGNAREAYKLATDRAPNSIEVWSKYIDTLIQSYEWDQAEHAMDRFRKLKASPSAIDKLAGDMYAKQGRHAEAQAIYKRAMSRDVIDPKVYIAYAESLVATQNYRDATFFFALALRFDPLNMQALLGTARAIAASDSIDRAIEMLQDELASSSGSRGEILAGIAEFQIQKADWEAAQATVDLAREASPDYAYPWKLQAQIYLNREGSDKKALDRALEAFKSYSDRNGSDPSGYMERYKIFIKKTEYDNANEELSKVFAIYPKYPNLHYFKGALYALMGNQKVSEEEFLQELKNNETNLNAMMALGKLYLDAGRPKDALDLFNKAMLLAPQAPEPKHQAGYANYVMKNLPGAIALFNAAIALDKANPILYRKLGMAYRDAGNPSAARAAFRKYLQMEPDASDKAQIERFL